MGDAQIKRGKKHGFERFACAGKRTQKIETKKHE